MADRSREKPLFLAPDVIGAVVSVPGMVWLRLGKPHPSLGFAKDISFAVELAPTEARALAQQLAEKADEAEGGSSATLPVPPSPQPE